MWRDGAGSAPVFYGATLSVVVFVPSGFWLNAVALSGLSLHGGIDSIVVASQADTVHIEETTCGNSIPTTFGGSQRIVSSPKFYHSFA